MRRLTLAMSLGLGLGLAATGCGPTADEPAPKPKLVEVFPKAPDADGAPKGGPGMGAMKGGPGMGAMKGGGDGPPPEIMKGMQTASYRNMPGSQGPGEAPKAKGGGPGGGMPPGYTPPPGTTGPGGSKPEPKTDGDAKPDEPKKDDKPAAEPKKDTVTLSVEEMDNIKKLSPEDQKLALAQKICPVNEEADGSPTHLGAMGPPIKETVNGKTVFLCCKSCIGDFKKDPDKFLAKLPK